MKRIASSGSILRRIRVARAHSQHPKGRRIRCAQAREHCMHREDHRSRRHPVTRVNRTRAAQTWRCGYFPSSAIPLISAAALNSALRSLRSMVTIGSESGVGAP